MSKSKKIKVEKVTEHKDGTATIVLDLPKKIEDTLFSMALERRNLNMDQLKAQYKTVRKQSKDTFKDALIGYEIVEAFRASLTTLEGDRHE